MNHTKMKDHRIISFPCSQCGKTIQYKAREGFDRRWLLDDRFIVDMSILVDTSDGAEVAAYLRRHAQFCSLECTIEYCHELKIEDFDIEVG